MEDRLQYDLLKKAHTLSMPMLFMVGENDTGTPPEHQRMLHDAIPHARKEIHVIKGAAHVFRDDKHLNEARAILGRWIDSWL
jgi:fermentation-respiration switch protein FrsA (DUF1100 family)